MLVDGVWVPGSMLGWRHDDTGACEAWVRPRAGTPGLGVSGPDGGGTWVGLAAVRLPERRLELVAPTRDLPDTRAVPAADAVSAADAVPPVGLVTADRPAHATVVMPAAATITAAGRPRRPRGHRAVGTAEQPAVGAGGAGRHRAPADPAPDADSAPGRHRALTTEMPAVAGPVRDRSVEPARDTARDAAPATTSADATALAPAVAPAVPAPQPAGGLDGLTRPIRLGDLVPSGRGGRPTLRPAD